MNGKRFNNLIRRYDFYENGIRSKLFYYDISNYCILPQGVEKGSLQFNQHLGKFITD